MLRPGPGHDTASPARGRSGPGCGSGRAARASRARLRSASGRNRNARRWRSVVGRTAGRLERDQHVGLELPGHRGRCRVRDPRVRVLVLAATRRPLIGGGVPGVVVGSSVGVAGGTDGSSVGCSVGTTVLGDSVGCARPAYPSPRGRRTRPADRRTPHRRRSPTRRTHAPARSWCSPPSASSSPESGFLLNSPTADQSPTRRSMLRPGSLQRVHEGRRRTDDDAGRQHPAEPGGVLATFTATLADGHHRAGDQDAEDADGVGDPLDPAEDLVELVGTRRRPARSGAGWGAPRPDVPTSSR